MSSVTNHLNSIFPIRTEVEREFPSISNFISRAVTWFRGDGLSDQDKMVRTIAAIACAVLLCLTVVGSVAVIYGALEWFKKDPNLSNPQTRINVESNVSTQNTSKKSGNKVQNFVNQLNQNAANDQGDKLLQLNTAEQASLKMAKEQEAQKAKELKAQQEAQKAAELKAQQEAQKAAELKALQEAQKAAELKALQEAQKAAELKAQQEAQKAAELKAQQEAQKAAELKAQQEAQKAAEKKAQEQTTITAAPAAPTMNNGFPPSFSTLEQLNLCPKEEYNEIVQKVNSALKNQGKVFVPPLYQALASTVSSQEQLNGLYDEAKILIHLCCVKEFEGSLPNMTEYKKYIIPNLGMIVDYLYKHKSFPKDIFQWAGV